MSKQLLKCHANHPDCFAYCDEKCKLLESYIQDHKLDGVIVRSYGTKFNYDCPFHKTIEQAGGTYDELCARYPLPDEKPKPARRPYWGVFW